MFPPSVNVCFSPVGSWRTTGLSRCVAFGGDPCCTRPLACAVAWTGVKAQAPSDGMGSRLLVLLAPRPTPASRLAVPPLRLGIRILFPGTIHFCFLIGMDSEPPRPLPVRYDDFGEITQMALLLLLFRYMEGPLIVVVSLGTACRRAPAALRPALVI